MTSAVWRATLIGTVAVAFVVGAMNVVSGRADGAGPAISGANGHRLTVPAVAGGARIDVPEPYQRNHSRPLVLLDSTVFAVPVIDGAGIAGIQISETLTESYSVWFPGAGQVAVFQGHPEYDAGCDCYVYDLGFARLYPFIFDDALLQQLTDGTYTVPDCAPKGIPDTSEAQLPAGGLEALSQTGLPPCPGSPPAP